MPIAIAEPPKPSAPAPSPSPQPAPATPSGPASPAPPAATPAPGPSGGSPPSSSAPSAQPSGTTPPKADNPFADIDKAVAEFAKPRPTTAPAPKEPKEPAAAPAAPAAAAKPAPVPAPELRKQYEQTKADLVAKEQALAALETKIRDYEARGKETESLQARVKQLEADVEARTGELRQFKFEASPDFKKDFERPWIEAGTAALQLMSELPVTDTGTGEQRMGSPDDFKRLYQLNAGQAFGMAKEVFGDAASMVMNHYFEVKRLENRMNTRLSEEKAQAVEKNKADEGARLVNQEKLKTAWQSLNKELEENETEYRDGPEETEFTKLRQQGYAIFDHKATSVEQQMIKNAHIRQRVAAFPVLQAKLAKAMQEIAQLKAEAEAAANPQPAKNKNPGGQNVVNPEPEDWAVGLRKSVTG